jgi:4-hydroxy 2-oxovalerate aldolase
MKHIKVLDCTLRDGGYINDFNFSREVITGIISRLVKSNIDIIECGFLKDVTHKCGYSVFSVVKDIEQYLPNNHKNTSFVAMIDYGRYDLSKLVKYDGKTIDGIRVCFFKNDRFEAIEAAKEIMDKGYTVYIQPVDMLGYTDVELLELIEKVNGINPYAFSIVDTFGSMFSDDLVRVFSLLNHNLQKDIQIGFHSHNNMQLSFALSQKIAEISQGKRQVMIDCSVLGLGRGAGNTPTELVLHYLNTKWYEYEYNLNELLDLIDIYMLPIQKKYNWGYNIPNYIAGIYSSHVHNVTYLMDKHNIHTKDMRIIIEAIEPTIRKRYDYDNLETLYINYVTNKIDDAEAIKYLADTISDRSILVLAPGKTLETHKSIIEQFINKNEVIIISANFIPSDYEIDFAFFSNQKRLESNIEFRNKKLQKVKLILTSNVRVEDLALEALVINYDTLITRKKWKYFDNAIILLFRLLQVLQVKKVFFAGVDGFSSDNNYAFNNEFLDTNISKGEAAIITAEVVDMFKDIIAKSPRKNFIEFITPSFYEVCYD